MRKLDYDTPGTKQDREKFAESLSEKSKVDLVKILLKLANACDQEGKGYVNQWEDTVRRVIGYTKGHGEDHADECGCRRCEKEGVGAYGRK